jgi:hypothetical protein
MCPPMAQTMKIKNGSEPLALALVDAIQEKK